MSAVWQLDASTARLSASALAAEIDLVHPEIGLVLRSTATNSDSTAAQLLSIRFGGHNISAATAPIDAYVRGADLVATFEESPPRQLRAQCYWRRLQPEQFAAGFATQIVTALDLILSVNTSLLANQPQSNVRSTIFGAAEVLQLRRDDRHALAAGRVIPTANKLSFSPNADDNQPGDTGAFIVKWDGSQSSESIMNRSWIQMVHPSDFCRATVGLVDDQATRTPGVQIIHDLFHQTLEKGVILRARVRGAIVERQHDEAIAVAAYQQFATAEAPLTV